MKHYSVLKQESLEYLNILEDGIYVDATLGYGGHSEEILKKLTTGMLYAFDKDLEAIAFSTERLSNISNRFHIIHSDFANMKEELFALGVKNVDGILFDLGVSSPQIDSTERGFSFMREENLDMRMDQTNSKSAKVVVNEYLMERLTEIFYRYGEEKQSHRIAKVICDEREKKEITTTTQLVEIIQKAV